MTSAPENSLAALKYTVPPSLCFFEVTNEIQTCRRPEAMTAALAAGEQ